MSKEIQPPIYNEPDKYEGTCVNCGHKTMRWDWDNNMKATQLGEMYCNYCRHTTTHAGIKKTKS